MLASDKATKAFRKGVTAGNEVRSLRYQQQGD